jgi:hypothetical protein
MLKRLLAICLALATVSAAPAYAFGGHHQAASGGWIAPKADNWRGHGLDAKNPRDCDPIDPAQCMLPYPNDWFTKPDPASATGRRLDLNVLAMPRNTANKPIEPGAWNRSDGFSAGAQILALVPGMTKNTDLAPSKLPSVADMSVNSDANAGVVVLDANTGARWPVWAEVDQYTQEDGAVATGLVQQDLMIHPAVNFADGHRYIVALRHLVTDNGATAQPSARFKAYRDRKAKTTDPRRAHMENLFTTLGKAGVGRSDLYLAWDFTTASTANVTGRLLAIRNNAFAQLGETRASDLAAGKVVGSAPKFKVQSVTDYTADQDSNVARQVVGQFTVPCYIAPTCSPPVKCNLLGTGVIDDCPSPGEFSLGRDPDAVPHQVAGQTYQANFICNVGRSAYEAHTKLRPVEYGHGLFGSAGEVSSGPQKAMAGRFGMLYCATDWFGMATVDVSNAVMALQDMSRFPFLTDRVQQGELNFLYLARLMVHAQGFSKNAAFKWSDGQSFIDRTAAYYDGNSQGGIYGGTVCAVSIDVRRCSLGVPGMDYSVLLPRSSDYVATEALSQKDPTTFDPTDPTSFVGYSNVFDLAYPDQRQRMLILDLIQTLWDRSDPNGYANHLTGGLPATPSHHALLQVAYGDHQVANVTAETEARTIGAAGLYPPLVSQRYGPYQDPFWRIPAIGSFPYDGSAITMFDTGPASNVTSEGHHGTDWPPTSDVPNRSGDDPHSGPRNAACGQDQKNVFLNPGGLVTNPCGGAPYFAYGWDGVSGL